MMELGSGIALSGACISAGAVFITAIKARSGNGKAKCADHSGICTKIEDFESWLDKIERKLDRVIEGKAERK